jgi:hypothetical protein
MAEDQESERRRREREMKAALERIRAFNEKPVAGWRLEIPVWKLAVEGIALFLLAFLMGLGLGVLYRMF